LDDPSAVSKSPRQITISVFFQVVRPIYSAIRDSSTGFRIFLQRFIGMPDKLRVRQRAGREWFGAVVI
jgi:hypothetical protein